MTFLQHLQRSFRETVWWARILLLFSIIAALAGGVLALTIGEEKVLSVMTLLFFLPGGFVLCCMPLFAPMNALFAWMEDRELHSIRRELAKNYERSASQAMGRCR